MEELLKLIAWLAKAIVIIFGLWFLLTTLSVIAIAMGG